MQISQKDAMEAFDVPEVYLYVCDGWRPCGRPSCRDLSVEGECHHTSDASHARYADHDLPSFERRPAASAEQAAVLCVEPVRG